MVEEISNKKRQTSSSSILFWFSSYHHDMSRNQERIFFIQKYILMKFATQSIHVWQSPDPTTGAIIPPLYLTTTYVQKAPGQYEKYDYSRSDNPNFTQAAETLASLEGADYALLNSSGMASMTTVLLSLLASWDKIVVWDDVYGWTFRLLNTIFNKFGIEFEQVNFNDHASLDLALSWESVKLLWIETPTNPLLKTTDIKKASELAKKNNVILVVDNTFATPYFQQPLSAWADVVVHSTTKYLGGHSDIVWGAIVTNNKEMYDAFWYHRNAAWTNPAPFNSWLLSRSLKTLAIRMERHQENAKRVVQFFESHDHVSKVYYPWFGWMVSVEFDLTLEQTKELISSFKLFRLAESLGGVESLVDHPATMTHGAIPRQLRIEQGLQDGLVRFSVGIEDGDDLVEDLRIWLDSF